jgi:hypothetical protein
MPEWLDTPGELLTVVLILGACMSALVWLIRSQIGMSREFRPNGGSSTRDALDRIERKLDNVESKVDGHIEWHLDNR